MSSSPRRQHKLPQLAAANSMYAALDLGDVRMGTVYSDAFISPRANAPRTSSLGRKRTQGSQTARRHNEVPRVATSKWKRLPLSSSRVSRASNDAKHHQRRLRQLQSHHSTHHGRNLVAHSSSKPAVPPQLDPLQRGGADALRRLTSLGPDPNLIDAELHTRTQSAFRRKARANGVNRPQLQEAADELEQSDPRAMNTVLEVVDRGKEDNYYKTEQVQRWMKTFRSQQKEFQSLALYCETTLQEVMQTTHHLPVPSGMRTAVLCQLFDQLCRHAFRSYQPMISTIKQELFKSIFCDFSRIAPDGSSQRRTVRAIFDAVPYFSALAEEKQENQRLRGVVQQFSQKFSVDRRVALIETLSSRWKKAVVWHVFTKWHMYTQHQNRRRRVMYRLLEQMDSKSIVKTYFTSWRHIVHKEKRKNGRADVVAAEKTEAAMASLEDLRREHNECKDARAALDARVTKLTKTVHAWKDLSVKSLQAAFHSELSMHAQSAVARLHDIQALTHTFRGMDWLDPVSLYAIVMDVDHNNEKKAQQNEQQQQQQHDNKEEEKAVNGHATESDLTITAGRHNVFLRRMFDNDPVGLLLQWVNFHIGQAETNAGRSFKRVTDFGVSWRQGVPYVLLLSEIWPKRCSIDLLKETASFKVIEIITDVLNDILSSGPMAGQPTADSSNSVGKNKCFFVVTKRDLADGNEAVNLWVLWQLMQRDPSLSFAHRVEGYAANIGAVKDKLQRLQSKAVTLGGNLLHGLELDLANQHSDLDVAADTTKSAMGITVYRPEDDVLNPGERMALLNHQAKAEEDRLASLQVAINTPVQDTLTLAEMKATVKRHDKQVDEARALLVRIAEIERRTRGLWSYVCYIHNLWLKSQHRLQAQVSTVLYRQHPQDDIDIAAQDAGFCSVDSEAVKDILRSQQDADTEMLNLEGFLREKAGDLKQVFRHYAADSTGRDVSTMDNTEFMSFVRDCKMMSKRLRNVDVDLIFRRVNWEEDKDANATSSEQDNPDRELVPQEFVHALVRLADRRFGSKSMGIAAKVKELWDRFIALYACRSDADHFRSQLREPAVREIFKKYLKPMRKVFAVYARGGKTGKRRSTSTIDSDEFFKLLKDCNLIDQQLTVARVGHIFNNVQTDEAPPTTSGLPSSNRLAVPGDAAVPADAPPSSPVSLPDSRPASSHSQVMADFAHSADSMNNDAEMIFLEFIEGIATVAVYRNPDPYKPFPKRLVEFLTGTLFPALYSRINGLKSMVNRAEKED